MALLCIWCCANFLDVYILICIYRVPVHLAMSNDERVFVLYRQMSNFSVILIARTSYNQWVDDDSPFLLDQHTWLDLLVIKDHLIYGEAITQNSFTGIEILDKYWSFKINFDKTKIILAFINMKEAHILNWIPKCDITDVCFIFGRDCHCTLCCFFAWHQY